MKVLSFGVFLDGGTFKITTDEGIFYVDKRGSSSTKGKMFKDYPKSDNSNMVNDFEIFSQVVSALDEYKSELFQTDIDDWLNQFGIISLLFP